MERNVNFEKRKGNKSKKINKMNKRVKCFMAILPFKKKFSIAYDKRDIELCSNNA